MSYFDGISEIIGNKICKQKPLVDGIEIMEVYTDEVAPAFKRTTIDPWDVCYEDDLHLYFINSPYRIPLISATTFVGLFEPEFDTDGMAMRCAAKDDYSCNCLNKDNWRGIDIQERKSRVILAWEQNNKEATSYGSAAHACMEYIAKHPSMADDKILSLAQLGVWGIDAVRPVIKDFMPKVRGIISTLISDGYEIVAEPVLFDVTVGLAGQSDLVAINHKKKRIKVLDYKTNKEAPKMKQSYSNMKGLFIDHGNIPIVHYSIQLSIYAVKLQKMYPGYEIDGLELIWLDKQTGDIEIIPIAHTYWMPFMQNIFNTLKANNVFKNAYNMMYSRYPKLK